MNKKPKKNKNMSVSYLLFLFSGVIGGHRFYVQSIQKAILYNCILWITGFLTNGLSIIFILIYELITIPRQVLEANGEIDELPQLDMSTRIKDMYKGGTYKKQLKELTMKINEAELDELLDLKKEYTRTSNNLSRKRIALKVLDSKISERETTISSLESKLQKLRVEQDKYLEAKRLERNIESLKKKSVYWMEIIEEEDNGIFTRMEELYPSLYYKDQLKINRVKQRKMKKEKKATDSAPWTVNGSITEGKKLTNSYVRHILRSFDNESDIKVRTLTFKNYNSKLKALRKSFEQLNKMNKTARVAITYEYLKLKEEELELTYKGLVKKEEEKEILRGEREKEREERRALKELNAKKKIVSKDIKHYDKMIEELNQKITSLIDENERLLLQNEIDELNERKNEKEEEKKDLDYRVAHAKAGYVYIISNIGSFGDNIFKIGVTRRLNPQERITELSSASVPFKYNVHAMIFSYDAYQLESELHRKFDDKRVNLVNRRKEFFNISIDEIKEALKEYGNHVINWEEDTESVDYYETIKLRKKLSGLK